MLPFLCEGGIDPSPADQGVQEQRQKSPLLLQVSVIYGFWTIM